MYIVQIQINEEIAEYTALGIEQQKITHLAANEQYKTLVDIGQQCYVQAVVNAPQAGVYVHIGLGFFVELSWSAVDHIAQKRDELLSRKAIQTQTAIESVQADLDEVCMGQYASPYSSFKCYFDNESF